MQLLETRELGLRQAMAGHNRTGVDLIAWNEGLLPAGLSDDPGLYFWAPKLARATGTDVVMAAHLMFAGWAIVCSLIGTWGLFRLFSSSVQRAVASTGVGLFMIIMLLTGDVYVVPAGLLVASLPWLLIHAGEDRPRRSHALGFVGLAALAGIAHGIRFQSWLPVAAALVLVWIIRVRGPWRSHSRTILLLGAIGLLAFSYSLNYLDGKLDNRDDFLANEGFDVEAVRAHPTWHSIYIGLGYIENPFGIEYKDENAAAKVASIDDDVAYVSAEYDAILRDETISIVTSYPSFVAELLAAKIGVVLLYFGVFANLGVLAAIGRSKSWHDIVLLATAGVSSAWGLLAIPSLVYLLPLMAMAVLFGVWSINRFLQEDGLARVSALIPRIL